MRHAEQQRPPRMSQVKSSRVGHSAVSSPPTLWQCQTSRPLPILLVLLLIREPASQPGIGKGGREGGKEEEEEAWFFFWKKSKGYGDTDRGEQEEQWNSCCSTALTGDTMFAEVKRYRLDLACDSLLLLR